MITKENFINLMEAMQEQREIDRKATEHLQEIFEDVTGGFYNNETLYSAIGEFLANTFHDVENWIEYFIYEIDWGTKWNETCCSESDGTIIDISTIEKLYDFLIKNMEEK